MVITPFSDLLTLSTSVVNLMYLIDITSTSAGREIDEMRAFVRRKKEALQGVLGDAE